MYINKSNGKKINSDAVDIHDDILNQLQFDRTKRCLYLKIQKAECINCEYTIEFVAVVGFEMTSCDFWGESPHILDFEYVDPNKHILLPKLTERIYANETSSLCKLNESSKLIETIITFTSGDELIVVCEHIILQEIL